MSDTRAIFIAIAGGQAAGKKCVQSALAKYLQDLHNASKSRSGSPFYITQLHQQDFLLRPGIGESEESRNVEKVDAYDLDRMADVVEKLRRGEKGVEIPAGNGKTTVVKDLPEVIIAEGCFLLCHRELVDMAGVKIFVDCDPDLRLARRVIRDSEMRGKSLDSIFDTHIRQSKAAFETIILPTKPISDIILPRGTEGPGIELIAQGVMEDLKSRGRMGTSKRPGTSQHSSYHLPITLSEADLTSGAPSYYDTV